MKYAVAMAGLILATPVLAAIPYANPPTGVAASQAGGLLSRLPSLPQTYDQAAAQWVMDDGKLVAGPALAAAEDAIKRAMTNLPNMQPAGGGNALMQHYMTPEGQTELKNMSQAQQMAIAQQMAAAAMAQALGPRTAGPVSEHDSQLVGKATIYPETGTVMQKVQQLRMAELAIGQKWRDARRALEDQESAQIAKLPVCPDEAGEPSTLAVRNVKLSYIPKHQATAATYLPQYAPLIAQLKTAIRPEIAHGDEAVTAWNQLESANMKQMMAASASGAEGAAIQDVATVLGFIQDASQIAAEPLLRRADIDRLYKDATDCSGRPAK